MLPPGLSTTPAVLRAALGLPVAGFRGIRMASSALGLLVPGFLAAPAAYAEPLLAPPSPPPSAQSELARDGSDVGFRTPGPSAAPVVHAEPLRLVGRDPRPRPDGAVLASVQDEELARWNTGGSGDPRHVSNRSSYHVAPRVVVDVAIRPGLLPERAPRPSQRGRRTLSVVAVLSQARSHGYWPFRLCYEDALREAPKLEGVTTVRASLAPDGHVTRARVSKSDLGARDVSTCLAEKVRSLRFAPGPGKRVELDLSIDLAPGDAPLPALEAGEAGTGSSGPATAPALPLSEVEPAVAPLGRAVADCYVRATSRDPLLWGRLELLLTFERSGRVADAKQRGSRFPAPEVVGCAVETARRIGLGRTLSSPAQVVWALRLGTPSQAATTPRDGGERAPVGAPGLRPEGGASRKASLGADRLNGAQGVTTAE